MNKIRVYHGSYCEVCNPSLDKGRAGTDFGEGFYLTPDLLMAEKWASRKKNAIMNEYTLEMDGLTAYSIPLDKEWLDFVILNRTGQRGQNILDEFDLIIGATADDKLFSTIEQYEDGLIDAETAVRILDCVKVGQQICVRTQRGLDHLQFCRSIELPAERVKELREINRTERALANQLSREIIRNRIRDMDQMEK